MLKIFFRNFVNLSVTHIEHLRIWIVVYKLLAKKRREYENFEGKAYSRYAFYRNDI